MKTIIGSRVVTPQGILEGMAVVYNEKIAALVPETEISRSKADEVLDVKGALVCPGFIDTHIHGYKGADASDADESAVLEMARALPDVGVTAFLPTVMTLPMDETRRALSNVRSAMKKTETDAFSARVLGCHLEGPFLNPAKKGAQDDRAVLPPDAELLFPYADVLKIVTLAPEMPGAVPCTQSLAKAGIRVSLGHTLSNRETALSAFEAGANRATHLFNAMPPIHHREPGVVGAALESNTVYAELIADRLHVHPSLFAMLDVIKGDHLCLVTDCNRAGGMKPGQYMLGGLSFTYDGERCVVGSDTLAGSVLTLNRAVHHLHCAGVPLHRAVNAASLNPARSIGLARKGAIAPGMDADFLIADDNMNPLYVIRQGETVRKMI